MIYPLTPLQTEILRLETEGLTRAELAEALYVSEGTIKREYERIRSVMGVPNLVAAVAEFVRQESA